MKIKIERVEDYKKITLKNSSGMTIMLTSLGAGIREICVPDKYGRSRTVTLCPQSEKTYRYGYHGKTIGRTAGRIENATFTIDGKTAVLEKNNYGEDNLHGGAEGLHAKRFGCAINQGKEYTDVVFGYTSPDGEGGYFGEVKINVTYRIYENLNKFSIIYDGKSDCKTLLNLTNHVYLNLIGDLADTVEEQYLYINAHKFGRLNERLIVEEVVPVTPAMDFTRLRKVNIHLEEEEVQRYTLGYDHPFFLSTKGLDDVACKFVSMESGISLEMRTTYPCVVFYGDNQATGDTPVFRGINDRKYLALCLECQYHPDGIHQEPANCGIVTPDKPYHEEIVYNFSVG